MNTKTISLGLIALIMFAMPVYADPDVNAIQLNVTLLQSNMILIQSNQVLINSNIVDLKSQVNSINTNIIALLAAVNTLNNFNVNTLASINTLTVNTMALSNGLFVQQNQLISIANSLSNLNPNTLELNTLRTKIDGIATYVNTTIDDQNEGIATFKSSVTASVDTGLSQITTAKATLNTNFDDLKSNSEGKLKNQSLENSNTIANSIIGLQSQITNSAGGADMKGTLGIIIGILAIIIAVVAMNKMNTMPRNYG